MEQVHLCKYNKYKWCATLSMKVPYQISPRWQVNVDPQQHIVHTETHKHPHFSNLLFWAASASCSFEFFSEKWKNTKRPRILFCKLKQKHRFSTLHGAEGGWTCVSSELCQQSLKGPQLNRLHLSDKKGLSFGKTFQGFCPGELWKNISTFFNCNWHFLWYVSKYVVYDYTSQSISSKPCLSFNLTIPPF